VRASGGEIVAVAEDEIAGFAPDSDRQSSAV
jgi:hypothetical protein